MPTQQQQQSKLPSFLIRLLAIGLIGFLSACDKSTPSSASIPETPIIAAHYFGRHWAPNFIAAFRHSEVAEDFAQIREDGFNTVILVVGWGDFQLRIDPCCEYDQRAFDRLDYLLDRAREAGLQVILRIGYLWTFNPGVSDVRVRMHQLLNVPSTREAFLAFVERIAESIRDHRHVVMNFMAWEDQMLHLVDESAEATVSEWWKSRDLLEHQPEPTSYLLNTPEYAADFHNYWDWLVIEKLYTPALHLLPNLSYEVRIDKEPVYVQSLSGQSIIKGWIRHDAMYQQNGSSPVTIYYAPFWGARNQGETLSAKNALSLFEQLILETLELADGKTIFIDQFNFIDNTPGYENNAHIATSQVDLFIKGSLCHMKRHRVIGYGIWTSKDYRESRLHNPAFGYGLEGWKLERGDDKEPASVLVSLPEGDYALQLEQGETLSQMIPGSRGRLVREGDGRADEICIRGSALHQPVAIEARAGANMPSTLLNVTSKQVKEICQPIVARPEGTQIRLALTAAKGTATLYDVWLHDHIQHGGLYDVDGQPAMHRDAIVALNHTFMKHKVPAYCK